MSAHYLRCVMVVEELQSFKEIQLNVQVDIPGLQGPPCPNQEMDSKDERGIRGCCEGKKVCVFCLCNPRANLSVCAGVWLQV